MKSLFYSLLSYFLTPGGLLVLAALDSSVVFFLPLGIDFVLIILTARKPDLFWLYAVLAAAGSIAGAAGTFWVGRKIGEAGLRRFVRASKLRRVERRVGDSAAMSVAALGLIPPPFPFTPTPICPTAMRCCPTEHRWAMAMGRCSLQSGR